MASRGVRRVAAALAVCVAAAMPHELSSQQPGGAPDAAQLQLLRGAAAREAVGDLTGAEALLREALRRQPASVSAILSIERVLRKEGRAAALVPLLLRFLENDPGSVLGRLMLLRTYSSMDDAAGVDSAAQDWLRAVPGSQAPVRNIAAVWRARAEPRRALAVLKLGRERFGGDAFALELGAVYGDLGEYGRAVEEWDRAIGTNAASLDAVRRDLRALPDGSATVIPALIHRLTRKPSNRARRSAAAWLALDGGLESDAQRWAQAAASGMPLEARKAFLLDMARSADARQLPHLSYWAYEQLLATADSVVDAPGLQSRAAELALALGDTAAAERHYRAIESAFAPGAPQRRRASALRIQLMAERGEMAGAVSALETFRTEYPQAAEVDGLVADVGEALLRRGQADDARRLIDGMTGPRCGLLRGRLSLAAGDADAARQAFTEAASGLHGTEGTAALELASLLAAVSPSTGSRIAAALRDRAFQPDKEMIRRLARVAGEVPPGDRPALLAYAATLADGVDPQSARRFWRLIADDYPTSRQAAAALLGLASSLAAQPDSVGRAQALLERLILDHPTSALVPEARRRLSRLEGEVPPADAASGGDRP